MYRYFIGERDPLAGHEERSMPLVGETVHTGNTREMDPFFQGECDPSDHYFTSNAQKVLMYIVDEFLLYEKPWMKWSYWCSTEKSLHFLFNL